MAAYEGMILSALECPDFKTNSSILQRCLMLVAVLSSLVSEYKFCLAMAHTVSCRSDVKEARVRTSPCAICVHVLLAVPPVTPIRTFPPMLLTRI